MNAQSARTGLPKLSPSFRFCRSHATQASTASRSFHQLAVKAVFNIIYLLSNLIPGMDALISSRQHEVHHHV